MKVLIIDVFTDHTHGDDVVKSFTNELNQVNIDDIEVTKFDTSDGNKIWAHDTNDRLNELLSTETYDIINFSWGTVRPETIENLKLAMDNGTYVVNSAANKGSVILGEDDILEAYNSDSHVRVGANYNNWDGPRNWFNEDQEVDVIVNGFVNSENQTGSWGTSFAAPKVAAGMVEYLMNGETDTLSKKQIEEIFGQDFEDVIDLNDLVAMHKLTVKQEGEYNALADFNNDEVLDYKDWSEFVTQSWTPKELIIVDGDIMGNLV